MSTPSAPGGPGGSTSFVVVMETIMKDVLIVKGTK
jgi:hypothetical protein